MKKFVFILTIMILSILLGLNFFSIQKYKKQLKFKNIEIKKLEKTIEIINLKNNKLSANNEFIEKQYEKLKTTKQKDELIDVEIQECMKNCNYTTVCMNECVYSSDIKWHREIESNIEYLKKNMTDKQKQLLDNSQKAWIEYKDAQQKLNRELIGVKVGTIYTNILSSEQVNIIKLRAIELGNLYYIFSE